MNKREIKERFDDKWVEKFLRKEEENILNKEHICPILKMLILRCFLCELKYDIDLTKAKNILLNDIIYVNQNIVRIMKQKYNIVFPDYFENLTPEDQEKCVDEKVQDWELNEYDIRPYYSKLREVIKKSDIPNGRLKDRILENCDYGLYIGCLMNLEVRKYDNLVPNKEEKEILNYIRDKFKYGMEIRFKKLKEKFNK